MNPLFAKLLQGFGGQQGAFKPTEGSAPGGAGMNLDMSGLIGALSQAQPRSGVVGLPQQQAQMEQAPQSAQDDFDVLPPLEGPDGVNMGGATPIPGDNFGMPDPTTWQNPGVQKQPMGMQGGVPNQGGQMGNTGQAQGASPGGLNWGSLLGMGTRDAPNALVRAGEGYNRGGLIGALGYLLTDMSRQNNNQQF